MKERAIPALVSLLMISAARASDIASTFHFNPSLSSEANPLVAWWGASAPTLVLVNIGTVVAFLLIPLFLYWRYAPAPLATKPATAREFICQQLYGRTLSTPEFHRAMFMAWPLPKNWLQAVRWFGFVITGTMAFASFHAAFSWWAAHEWDLQWYNHLRYRTAIGGYPSLEIISAMTAGIFIAKHYCRMEFESFKRQSATEADR